MSSTDLVPSMDRPGWLSERRAASQPCLHEPMEARSGALKGDAGWEVGSHLDVFCRVDVVSQSDFCNVFRKGPSRLLWRRPTCPFQRSTRLEQAFFQPWLDKKTHQRISLDHGSCRGGWWVVVLDVAGYKPLESGPAASLSLVLSSAIIDQQLLPVAVRLPRRIAKRRGI